MSFNDINWGSVPDWLASIAFVLIAVELVLDPKRPHLGKKPDEEEPTG